MVGGVKWLGVGESVAWETTRQFLYIQIITFQKTTHTPRPATLEGRRREGREVGERRRGEKRGSAWMERERERGHITVPYQLTLCVCIYLSVYLSQANIRWCSCFCYYSLSGHQYRCHGARTACYVVVSVTLHSRCTKAGHSRLKN